MKPIKTDTFLEFSFCSNPVFSHKGDYLAYQVQTADLKENGYRSDLYLYRLKDGNTVRLTGGGDAKSMCWTPEDTILFPCMRNEEDKKSVEEGNLLTCYYEISPNGGEAVEAFRVPVTATQIKHIEGSYYLLSVLHDNRYPDVAGLPEKEAAKLLSEWKHPCHQVIDELPFWFNGKGFVNGKRNRLYLYDRAADKLMPMTDTLTDCGHVSLLGDLILYSGYRYEHIRGRYDALYLYHWKTGKLQCLLPQDTLDTGAFALLSEKEALVAVNKGEEFGNNRYPDFYKMNLENGALTLFTPYEASIGYGTVGSDARLGGGRGAKYVKGEGYYFLTTIDDSSFLRLLKEDGTLSEPLTEIGSCDCFDISEGHIALCGMYGDKLAEIYLDGKAITDFSAVLKDYSISTPNYHSFTYENSGLETELHGWAMKPVGYEEGKTYPAILHIHGGPRTVFGTIFHHEMQVWANAGYFVFYCNPRGSDGRGNAFGDINGKYGTIDYDDLMEFTDQMLARYPQVDKSRVGVAGGSYGGYMTNWIIGHTDRFAAAASQRSIANWVTFEHTSDIGPTFTPDNQATTTREDVEKLWWHSPLRYAHNCKTPTLFIHSDQDYRCYMADGFSMFSALKRNGCPTRLCLFHDETHELSRSGKPKNRIHRMEEILGWMNQYLKGNVGGG